MAKPCLGYPTRTAAVLALRQRGDETNAIAARIGIEPKTVLALEASAAKRVGSTARREHPGHAVLLPTELFRVLGPHAAKRGRSVSNLARTILKTVTDENMIDAVLDDGAGWGEA